MSLAAKAILKPMSMVTNSCLISVPSLFSSTKASTSDTYLSVPLKPVKLQLTCSYSSLFSRPLLFSLKKKEHFLKVSVITARQEENNSEVLEEEEQGFKADFNWEESGNVENYGVVEDVELSEEAKIYVGNIPYDVDSERLAQLFGQAGVVEIAEVIYNRETDQSRGFGFVTMSTVEEAEKALEMFHRYDLNGRFLTVNKATPKESRPERSPRVFERSPRVFERSPRGFERTPRGFEHSYRIYAGNLPWSVDDSRLEQLFSKHGKVINARVACDRETGRSRGFGFVIMSSEAEMYDAVANLDGLSLDGRAIRVNIAEERPRRSSF